MSLEEMEMGEEENARMDERWLWRARIENDWMLFWEDGFVSVWRDPFDGIWNYSPKSQMNGETTS